MKKVSSHYDIAIVGGGIAGIYTAWRLMTEDAENPEKLRHLKKGDKLTVAVYEGSDHIGGRLVSATPPGFKHAPMVCEIGGMRIVSSQKLIYSLVMNKLKDQLTTRPQDVDEPINIINLRSRLLRLYQLNDPSVLPYWLSDEEKNALTSGDTTANNLIGWAVLKILPEIAERNLSGDALDQFLQMKKVDGVPLYQHGFWNLISKVLSNEGREIAIKTVGYDILGGNCNAVNCISEYFNFTPTVQYRLINEGYDAVPWLLQDEFENAGGDVHMNHWLHCFDECTLEDGKKGVKLQFGKNHEEAVTAGALVLAMPRRSLELISPSGPVLDPEKNPDFQYLMNSVTPIPLFKMCLVYDQPWWEKQFVTKGRSLTDMPVRQLYYWGVDVDPKTQKTGNAVLMAYNDMESSIYWGGFRTAPLGPWEAVADDNSTTGQTGDARHSNKLSKSDGPVHIKRHTHSTKFERTMPADPVSDMVTANIEDKWDAMRRKNWQIHEAPNAMVMEMHHQIMKMHGITSAPEPVDAAFIDWADDPFGGAVHFWNSGYKSWEIMPRMVKPVSDFPCYVIGEAWSENQTWAEGSLQTSEILLQNHFGLTPPNWIIDGE